MRALLVESGCMSLPRNEGPDKQESDRTSDELSEYEADSRGRRDPGEGVAEDAAGGDRRIREAGRTREQVRGADIRRNGRGRQALATETRQHEDDHDQPGGRDHL